MKKSLKYAAIIVAGVVAILVLLPILFPEKVTENLKKVLNNSLNTQINFEKMSVSFFRHFPQLTVSLNDFSATGSAPFSADTLISGKELGFGVNLLSLFSDNIKISAIYLTDARIKIERDSLGNGNFMVMKESADSTSSDKASATSDKASAASDKSSAAADIERIILKNCSITLNDSPSGAQSSIEGIDFKGRASYMADIFKIRSSMSAESVSFSYASQQYVSNKRVTIDSEFSYDLAKSLLIFSSKSASINKMPLLFGGEVEMSGEKVRTDITVTAPETALENYFSLVPQQYSQWYSDTKFKGKGAAEIKIAGTFDDSLGTAPDMSMMIFIKDGYILHKAAKIPLEKINLSVSLAIPSLNPDNTIIDIKSSSFKIGNGETNIDLSVQGLKLPQIKANIKSAINLGELSKSIGLPGYDLKGELNLNAIADGKLDTKSDIIPVTDVAISFKNGFIQTPFYPQPIDKINLEGVIKSQNGTLSDLKVLLNPLTFVFEGKPFDLKADLLDFANLKYNIKAKGEVDLKRIYQVFAINGISLVGELNADLTLIGSQLDLIKGRYEKLDNEGRLTLSAFMFRNENYPFPFFIPEAEVVFDKEKAILNKMKIMYNANTFIVDGYTKNYIGYSVLGQMLEGDVKISSDRVNIDDFMSLTKVISDSTANSQSVSAPTGVVMIPRNLNVKMSANIKEVEYSGNKISSLTGAVSLKDGKLGLNNTSFKVAGARFKFNALYAPISEKSAEFSLKVKADSFDIKRAHAEIPMFKKMVPSASTVEGLVSLDYALGGKLDDNMSPIMPSLKGDGFIRLDRVKVKGHKILGAVSRATGRDSINNPDLKGVVIKSKIKNNIIKIERTKMKIFGFRPRFEGEASLDGKLNLNFRLGLPPLGIIGIPMTITGTADKPKINLRRGRETDKLEETAIDQEDQ